MEETQTRIRRGILLFGLAQGLLLLVAHELIQRAVWPGTEIAWRFAWFSVAIAVPTALALSWDGRDVRRLALAGLALTVLLAVLGAWTGEQTGSGRAYSVVMPYLMTLAVGWYVLVPFLQIWQTTGRRRFPYPALFEHAWNNAFTLAIAGLFTGVFKGLLVLWAGLFEVVGVSFFKTLFASPYFSYPVLALVFGFALYLARTHVNAVGVARRIVLTVFKSLLPLLALIALLFLAELPFSGLAPLWKTGHATALLLALIILMILFVNAVYQDGQGAPPYLPWVRRGVEAAVLLLPVYSGLALYSLGLRIAQHGWSVDRFWAMLLVVVTGLYVLGYALAVVRRQGAWLGLIGRINVAMAVLLLALVVLVNTPVLDARRISAVSQIARLMDGRVTATEFDYRYLRFELGRVGERALEQLGKIEGHDEAALIRERATAMAQQANPWEDTPEQLASAADVLRHLNVYPAGHSVDDTFLVYLRKHREEYALRSCFVRAGRCTLLALDMNRDKRDEYVLIEMQPGGASAAQLYTRETDGWRHVGRMATDWRNDRERGSLDALLVQRRVSVQPPVWQDLVIGERRYQLQNW